MKTNHDLDCIELREKFDRQLARQSYNIYAFSGEALPGPSIHANRAYLLAKALAWLEQRGRAGRNSFSLWAGLSSMPWWTGHACTCLYLGGTSAARLLGEEMRCWEEYVAMEGADPRAYDTILACYYDPRMGTLFVSKPLLAAFLPSDTNDAQDDDGQWILTGMRARMEGEWITDFTTESSAFRTFDGIDDIEGFLGGSVQIHLEKLPAGIVRKLTIVQSSPGLGSDMIRLILANAKSVKDVERFLAQVEVVYGKEIALWQRDS